MRWSGNGERDVEVCSDEEQVSDEAGARYQERGRALEGLKVTPPLAVAPPAHGGDMQWNPSDEGINFNP